MLRCLPILVLMAACAGGGSDSTEDSDTTTPDTLGLVGLPSLGNGSGSLDEVIIEIVVQESDGLANPSDIEFQPGTGKAFVMNRKDDSLLVLHDPNGSDPDIERKGGEDDVVGANHFLAKPSGMAFSDNGDWASIHMEDKKTQGPTGTPADFMGPTLWTGDTDILDGGHASHLDMLHNTPNGAGIAWVSGNSYYVFDGYHESITFYDFRNDHGLGGADHTDGQILRCLEGEVSWNEDTVAHLVHDGEERVLYIVDTGNNRIIAMDTSSGALGGPIPGANYDGLGVGQRNYMDAVDWWVVADTEAAGMEEPAGMEMHDGVLYVTDHTQGAVYAFDKTDGALLDFLDLDVGGNALQGMGIDDNGVLWFVDQDAETVFRVLPK